MALYVTVYDVGGRGEFPLDMLRYDESFPAVEGDIERTLRSSSSWHTIKLKHVAPDKYWRPTYLRWRSYGWTVLVEGVFDA